MKYCYVVTCEKPDGSDVRISGACYHNFENALKFIEGRSDRPIKMRNPMIWKSETYTYKIHPLTFND